MRMKKRLFYIILIVLNILIVMSNNASAFLFDDNYLNHTFDIDNHIVESEHEFKYGYDTDPDAHLIEETNKDEIFNAKSIDPKRDLEVNKIEDLMIVSIFVFVLMLLFSFFMLFKKFSGLSKIFIVFLVVLIFVLIGIAFFKNGNLITHLMYGGNEKIWSEVSMRDFELSMMDDMNLVYDHSKTTDELGQVMVFSKKDFNEDNIKTIDYYQWEKDSLKREAIVIEFLDDGTARDFAFSVFQPVKKHRLLRENYFYGKLNSYDDDYSEVFLFDENKYLFFVWGPNYYSENVVSTIVKNYPEEYHFQNDKTSPTINLIKPKGIFVNDDTFEFVVYDTHSGLNKKDINVFGLKSIFNSAKHCTRDNNHDNKYYCKVENAFTIGENNIIINAQDLENNKNSMNIDIFLDLKKPVINIIDEENINDKLVFEAIDDNNISKDLVFLQIDDKWKSLYEECIRTKEKIVCNMNLKNHLREGKNIFTIMAKDFAGNEQTKVISFVVDATPPRLIFKKPTSKYSKHEFLEFDIIERESALKESSTIVLINGQNKISECQQISSKQIKCTFENILEKINKINIVSEDVKGNKLDNEKIIIYDKVPPNIYVQSYKNEKDGYVSFSISDDNSGINIRKIILNGNTFFVPDICLREHDGSYSCDYEMDFSFDYCEIKVFDNAGNMKIQTC